MSPPLLNDEELQALQQATRHPSHELAVTGNNLGTKDAHATLESLARRGLLQRWRTERQDDGITHVYRLTVAGRQVLAINDAWGTR